MAGKTERKGHLNIRFSDTARWILDTLQQELGLSQASVVAAGGSPTQTDRHPRLWCLEGAATS